MAVEERPALALLCSIVCRKQRILPEEDREPERNKSRRGDRSRPYHPFGGSVGVYRSRTISTQTHQTPPGWVAFGDPAFVTGLPDGCWPSTLSAFYGELCRLCFSLLARAAALAAVNAGRPFFLESWVYARYPVRSLALITEQSLCRFFGLLYSKTYAR